MSRLKCDTCINGEMILEDWMTPNEKFFDCQIHSKYIGLVEIDDDILCKDYKHKNGNNENRSD